MKHVHAATVDAVRKTGVVHVRCLGIPFALTHTPTGGVKAFIPICPHDWIVMDRPALQEDCLVCPVHAATFDASSGAVANTRGKRITEGLREAQVEIRDGQVLVAVERAHYIYLLNAWLRRTRHSATKLTGRRRSRKRGRS